MMQTATSSAAKSVAHKNPPATFVMGDEGKASAPVLDVDGAVARLGGDEKLYADLVGYFFEDAPPLFDDLRGALEAQDAATIRARAHALKGLLAGCGAIRAAKVAQALEDAGQSSNFPSAFSLIEALDAELDLLTQSLEPYRR